MRKRRPLELRSGCAEKRIRPVGERNILAQMWAVRRRRAIWVIVAVPSARFQINGRPSCCDASPARPSKGSSSP